jgi:hypothetical protein
MLQVDVALSDLIWEVFGMHVVIWPLLEDLTNSQLT